MTQANSAASSFAVRTIYIVSSFFCCPCRSKLSDNIYVSTDMRNVPVRVLDTYYAHGAVII